MYPTDGSIPVWAGANASPGFSPTDPFRNPSFVQAIKNTKHGVYGGHGISTGLSAGSYFGNASATEYFSGVDVEQVFITTWFSGFILHPNAEGLRRGHRPSLFLTTTSALGGRNYGGSPLVYSGNRINRPDCASSVHSHADTIDPTIDGTAECPRCHSQYAVGSIPRFCICGWPMANW